MHSWTVLCGMQRIDTIDIFSRWLRCSSFSFVQETQRCLPVLRRKFYKSYHERSWAAEQLGTSGNKMGSGNHMCGIPCVNPMCVFGPSYVFLWYSLFYELRIKNRAFQPMFHFLYTLWWKSFQCSSSLPTIFSLLTLQLRSSLATDPPLETPCLWTRMIVSCLSVQKVFSRTWWEDWASNPFFPLLWLPSLVVAITQIHLVWFSSWCVQSSTTVVAADWQTNNQLSWFKVSLTAGTGIWVGPYNKCGFKVPIN